MVHLANQIIVVRAPSPAMSFLHRRNCYLGGKQRIRTSLGEVKGRGLMTSINGTALKVTTLCVNSTSY